MDEGANEGGKATTLGGKEEERRENGVDQTSERVRGDCLKRRRLHQARQRVAATAAALFFTFIARQARAEFVHHARAAV